MADTTPHFKGDGKLQFRSETVIPGVASSTNINLFFSDINATNNTAVLPKGAIITAVTITNTAATGIISAGDLYVRTATTNTSPIINFAELTNGATIYLPSAGVHVPTAAANTQVYIARAAVNTNTSTVNMSFIGTVEYKIIPVLYA